MNKNLIYEISEYLDYEEVDTRTSLRVMEALQLNSKEMIAIRDLVSIIVDISSENRDLKNKLDDATFLVVGENKQR
jgi:hypothetical protein